MKRRSFLASILAAGYAPAAVGSGVLMPVRQLWTPTALLGQHILFPRGMVATFGDTVNAATIDGLVVAAPVLRTGVVIGMVRDTPAGQWRPLFAGEPA